MEWGGTWITRWIWTRFEPTVSQAYGNHAIMNCWVLCALQGILHNILQLVCSHCGSTGTLQCTHTHCSKSHKHTNLNKENKPWCCCWRTAVSDNATVYKYIWQWIWWMNRYETDIQLTWIAYTSHLLYVLNKRVWKCTSSLFHWAKSFGEMYTIFPPTYY